MILSPVSIVRPETATKSIIYSSNQSENTAIPLMSFFSFFFFFNFFFLNVFYIDFFFCGTVLNNYYNDKSKPQYDVN